MRASGPVDAGADLVAAPVPLPDAVHALFRFLMRSTGAADGVLIVRHLQHDGADSTLAYGPDGKPIVRRKTLQLKFKRVGDESRASWDQIRYLGHDWIYATAEVPDNTPDAAPGGEKPAGDKPAAEKKADEAPGQGKEDK